MNHNKQFSFKIITRGVLIAIILLSGLAFLPFIKLQAAPLNWQLFAGVYQPDLDADPHKGAPGSAFLFQASGYPPHALGTIYIDGTPIGMVYLDGAGQTEFVIQTAPSDPYIRYDVTLATDPNTLDSRHFDLEDDEPLLPPPPNFEGGLFFMDGPQNPPILMGSPAANGKEVDLTWVDYSYQCGHRVYQSALPYFTPSASTLLTSLPPTAPSYTASLTIGTHSYIVMPISCNSSTTQATNEIGVVQFMLE